MNKKRLAGFFLLFLGILIILSRVVITGAIIGANTFRYFNLFGILIFIAGILLLIVSRESKKSKLEDDLSKEDMENLRYLSPRDKATYISRRRGLDEIKKTVGGESPFYVPPIERGEATYVHLTTSKARASSIIKNGLNHGGPNTYCQAFIFTGADSYQKAREFVDSLSNRDKYVGVKNPTNAIIFNTSLVPVLNQFSGAILKNYRGRWKAMFRYDIPTELMRNIENRRISA